MANVGLDTTQYERTPPSGSALPNGVYTLTVVRVQQKQTNDKNGVYEEVEFDISQPQQYSNRKFWDRFNIVNKSQKAEQIGREGFADLAKACGILGVINDDQEILGKTVQGRLVVKPSDNPRYPEPKNECRKYYPVGVDADAMDKAAKGGLSGQSASGQAAVAKPRWDNAGTPAPAAQQAAADTPPWKR